MSEEIIDEEDSLDALLEHNLDGYDFPNKSDNVEKVSSEEKVLTQSKANAEKLKPQSVEEDMVETKMSGNEQNELELSSEDSLIPENNTENDGSSSNGDMDDAATASSNLVQEALPLLTNTKHSNNEKKQLAPHSLLHRLLECFRTTWTRCREGDCNDLKLKAQECTRDLCEQARSLTRHFDMLKECEEIKDKCKHLEKENVKLTNEIKCLNIEVSSTQFDLDTMEKKYESLKKKCMEYSQARAMKKKQVIPKRINRNKDSKYLKHKKKVERKRSMTKRSKNRGTSSKSSIEETIWDFEGD